MAHKKGYLVLSITLLLSVSGCGRKMKKQEPKHKKHHVAYNDEIFRAIDIPLAKEEIAIAEQEGVSTFFDSESQEFVAYDQEKIAGDNESLDVLTLAADEVNQFHKKDYAWVDAEQDKEFKTVYFNFDKQDIRPDQESIVEADVIAARAILEEAHRTGENPIIVIEGHACHSAGSSLYNMAKSEKRAHTIAQFFVSEGIPQENIKIVGRGQDVPVVAHGNREEQAPNRRVEVKVIYT